MRFIFFLDEYQIYFIKCVENISNFYSLTKRTYNTNAIENIFSEMPVFSNASKNENGNANSVDPDQTQFQEQSDLGVHYLLRLIYPIF